MRTTKEIFMERAYELYCALPLATTSSNPEIYQNGWCVLTGRAIIHPHPHRHFTFEEFTQHWVEDDKFAKLCDGFWNQAKREHSEGIRQRIQEGNLRDGQ